MDFPEYHFATWPELTHREKAEALFRGFPSDAVFKVKRRYGDMDWTLLGWCKGTPKRNASGIIRGIA